MNRCIISKQLNIKTIIFSLLFILISLPCFAKNITVTLDNKLIEMPISPINESGTTLVPIRVITENMGSTVTFNQDTQSISIMKNHIEISLSLGSKKAIINQTETNLSVAPKVINGVTMVPLRFISEAFNCIVDFDQTSGIIKITSPTKSNISIATLKIKDYGTIKIELYEQMAPNTVKNFTNLANSGFYDGLIFHRVISSFMIQGGAPTGSGIGGSTHTINGEFSNNGFTQNTLSHTKGVISMARTSDPNSASSQFFITSADALHLDGNYAAFGRVISGLEIIDLIEKVDTNQYDKPVSDVVIESIRVK